MEGFLSLIDSCKRLWPRDVIVPVRKGEKHPMVPHSGGRWSWAKLARFLDAIEKDASFDACVLLDDLCVIDVDSAELADELERAFPLLTSVPREATKRGRHYWFQRSVEADVHGYYDGCAQRIPGVDFKSKYRNGTNGVIMVAPSTDKKWMDAACTIEHVEKLVPIPFELLDHVAVPQHHKVRRRFKYLDEEREVDDELCLDQLAFFEPFLANDFPEDETISVPCTRAELAEIAELITLKDFDFKRVEELSGALRVADLLGADMESIKRRILYGKTFWRVDLEAAWPEMAAAMFSPSSSSSERVTDPIVYEPPSLPPHDERRLFPRARPRVRGEVVRPLSSDDVAVLLTETVASSTVLELLKRFPMMLAGGAALGLLATPGSGILRGSDYDLFVHGVDEEAADAMMTELMATTFAEGWTKTQTRCAYTFVHDESALEDHISTIQIIVQIYPKPETVFESFDIAPCMVGILYDPTREAFEVLAAKQWFVALRSMTFAVNPGRWTSSAAVRAVKYAKKGFDVVLPGLRRAFVAEACKATLPGVASLLYIEDQTFGLHPACRTAHGGRLYNAIFRLNFRNRRGAAAANNYGDQIKTMGLFPYIVRNAVREAMRLGREWVTRVFGERFAGTRRQRRGGEPWMCMWFMYDPRSPAMLGAESPRTWLLHRDRAGFEAYATHELFHRHDVMDRPTLDLMWPLIESSALAPLVAQKLDSRICDHVRKLVAKTAALAATATFGDLDAAAKAVVHGFLEAHDRLHEWNNYAVVLKDTFGNDGVVQMVADIICGKLSRTGFFKNVLKSAVMNKPVEPGQVLQLMDRALEIAVKDGLHVGLHRLREDIKALPRFPPKTNLFTNLFSARKMN